MPSRLRRIDIDRLTNDVAFYFDGDTEPYNANEFKPETFTRRVLDRIEYEIVDYNTEVELDER